MNDFSDVPCSLGTRGAMLAVLATCLLPRVAPADAATVWNGPTTTFTKAASTDPTQAANQDRLTAIVWLTRSTGGSGGLYNAKTEIGYTHFSSPADTEWAYGQLADYASLTYTSWEGMFGGQLGGGPLSSIGKDAVVHLKTDDIYLSLKLTDWAAGSLGGGGFSYVRSTPGATQLPPPAPVLGKPTLLGGGSIRFSFTNTPGYTFSVLATTNLALPVGNWTVVGSITDNPPGSYQFTDPGTTASYVRRFYVVRWP